MRRLDGLKLGVDLRFPSRISIWMILEGFTFKLATAIARKADMISATYQVCGTVS